MNDEIIKITWKYRLEYAGFLIAAAIFSTLPIEWGSAISGFAWRTIAPRTHRHARARANIARAYPDLDPAAREKILLDSWDNLGRTFAESFQLPKLAFSDRVTVADPGILTQIQQLESGAVFCLAHMANWEITASVLLRVNVEAAGIYQAIHNPLVDAYVLKQRSVLYRGGLWSKEDNSVRKMMRYARKGGTACIMTDLPVFSGIEINFFGTPAPTSPFPAMMALQMNLPLFVVAIRRDKGVRFTVHAEEIKAVRSDDREADIQAMTQVIHSKFESYIRDNPGQWMWGQRRWG